MRRRARHLTLLSLLNEQGTVQRSLSVFVLGLDTALVLLVLVSGQVQVEALVLGCYRLSGYSDIRKNLSVRIAT